MSETTAKPEFVNFDPQKIMQAVADILGDRYGAEVKITVRKKTAAELKEMEERKAREALEAAAAKKAKKSKKEKAS